MKYILTMLCLSSLLMQACGQSPAHQNTGTMQKVGDGCEGCEAIFESPIPFEKLSWIDTLPDFFEAGPRMEISGKVFQSDGKTPAPGVVLYIYHTDQAGLYPNKNKESNWAARHGYIRGWMKTNEKGEYKFYTLRPASYPNSTAVQHIHPTVKEPGKNEYWIDEFVFADDPFLTASAKNSHQQRGGDGVIKLMREEGLLKGHRDIILGKNIPNYPK